MATNFSCVIDDNDVIHVSRLTNRVEIILENVGPKPIVNSVILSPEAAVAFAEEILIAAGKKIPHGL